MADAQIRQSQNPTPMLDERGDTGPVSAAIAQGLAGMGIRPGDEIAVVGNIFDCYYARLARIRMVAQIWENPDRIVGLSAPQVQELMGQLKTLGVKALLSRVKPGFVNDRGWVGIPHTDVYVRLL